MSNLTLHRYLARRTQELMNWQRAALGLLVLSVTVSTAQSVLISRLDDARRKTAAQLEQTERARDYAISQLGELALQAERDKQTRVEQAAAYEAVGSYTYIGECTITAYCPCEECCGPWADSLTSTGLPAGPGIVAVDPEVVPLGSRVVIDGQRYLAADIGGAVKGLHVDICMDNHEETVAFGVQTAEVWVEVRP